MSRDQSDIAAMLLKYAAIPEKVISFRKVGASEKAGETPQYTISDEMLRVALDKLQLAEEA